MREEILKHLQTKWVGKSCQSFAVLDSTNEYAKRLAAKTSVHGLLITAQAQSAGKGRRGRTWQSPDADNVYMTVCLEPTLPVEHVAGLTLVMALAVMEAVGEVTGEKPGIKWPNDLVLHKKKLCGILTELIFRDESYAVLIGVGINVNTMEFPTELMDTATSLKKELGRECSKEVLIAQVLRQFETCYEQYVQTGDLSSLQERYESALVNRGKEVHVLDPKGAYVGTAQGITTSGNLIVTDADGKTHFVDSGEVSVRGLYGYV